MKRRNWFSLLLALMFSLALPLSAGAKAEGEVYLLEGLVTELVDGGFLITDVSQGEVLVNVDALTVLDGDLTEGELAVGQYAFVQYDGRMTRSLPPQVHADKVGVYTIQGTAGTLLEMGVLVNGDERYGDVIVRFDGSQPHVNAGVPIVAYYDGVMALSFPGQVNARHIVVPQLTGTVSDKDEVGFTLTTAEGDAYRVLMEDTTWVGVLPPADEDVPLTLDAESDIPLTIGEIDLDAALANAPDAPDVPPLEWGNGDEAVVYHNGEMTDDELPQVVALEVCILR